MIISDIKIQMEEVNNLMQKKLEKEKNKIEQANKEINITIEQQQQIKLLKSNIAKKNQIEEARIRTHEPRMRVRVERKRCDEADKRREETEKQIEEAHKQIREIKKKLEEAGKQNEEAYKQQVKAYKQYDEADKQHDEELEKWIDLDFQLEKLEEELEKKMAIISQQLCDEFNEQQSQPEPESEPETHCPLSEEKVICKIPGCKDFIHPTEIDSY